MAYICGFGDCIKLYEYVEYSRKLKIGKLIKSGTNETIDRSICAKDVIN